MKVEHQALVSDVGEDRKRWVVLLAVRGGVGAQLNWEHASGAVDPSEAIREAIRKNIPYAHDFRPAVQGRAQYADERAVSHPSVENGWLRITVFTEAGLELPEVTALVRLQGHGGARETSLEVADTMEDFFS